MNVSPKTKRWGVATLICLAVATAAAARQRPADLIVTNAKVVTMNRPSPRANAFAVRGGNFVAVGDVADVAPYRGAKTRVIDARGHTVIPGLVDSHSHAIRQGRLYNLELRWDGVDSLERGLAMIREQAGRTPRGQWVQVIGGWSPYQFKERRLPTVRELNEAAPDTPVFVLFLYSRGLLNRAGVEAMKLTPQTKAPEGGRFEFVEGGGAILHAEPRPTILYQAVGRLPPLSPDEQTNSNLHWYRELNRFGLTGVVDAGGGGHAYPKDYASADSLAKQNRIPLRVSMYLFTQTAGAELRDYEKWGEAVRLNFNLAAELPEGYVTEGAGENLVHSAGDYENFMAPPPELSDEKLRSELTAVTTLLVRQGWPIRIHATYDPTITKVLDVFEQVFRAEDFKGRWIIDHAEGISDRNIERVKRLGGGVAVQNRMAFAGEYYAGRYGKEAAAAAPPLRKLLDSGVPLGAGTDMTRVSSYNPWLSLYWMVSGRTVGGTELYTRENRLTREEALRLYTLGSAWFSGEEEVKGRIAPGQYADFAVLSADYLSVPEEQIKNIESVLTVVAGKIVYAERPFRNFAPAPLPAVTPAWSPVAHFGGYQRPCPPGPRRR
ncbi:MAG TPA: amidohydrolase [Pyrinomonadaceae bacterium]|nr:amidohydrolase [Pyrinomonadaceae bacterium]